MPISLPDNIKPASPVFVSEFQYVVLPFPFLRLSWNNGNFRASQAEGAQHFGGFQRGETDIQEDLAKLGLTTLPAGFTEPTKWLDDNGRAYMARSSRYIYAAPIKAKVDWYEEKDQKSGEMKKRHRLDFLVYLSSLENKVLVPWGPAVISRTGYAASAIEDAFHDYVKDTAEARAQFAPGVDPMFFYACVGTFGGERIDKKAGDSSYVPCQFNRPEKGWTEKLLEIYFVGEEIAAIMVSLQQEAEEWFQDTKANRQKANKPEPVESVRFGAVQPEEIDDSAFPF